ncbi:MAG: class I poly(R)-hydroxyalkanoic acid synthase [Sphingobacteriia bacterium]|nr:class I poly(R)-hydroxyalkanoic acid synthase [Sphingobacteriia bacterium]
MPHKKPVERLSENIINIMSAYPKIMSEFFGKLSVNNTSYYQTPYNIFNQFWQDIYQNPDMLAERQQEWVNNHNYIIKNVLEKINGSNSNSLYESSNKDNRFQDPAWKKNAYFNYIKQVYLMTNEWVQKLIATNDNFDAQTKHKINFFTRQILDALSPSNFIHTNPAVLREIIDSNADNLLLGLDKLQNDICNSNTLQITTVDKTAFKVGENLATTKGHVIKRSKLSELIVYTPKNNEVYETPILIIPPFINKYYILDLQEKNSFVNWLLEQGHQVCIVSWANPDSSYADVNFDDYVNEVISNIEAVKDITKQPQISLISYCIGGTLTISTLAYLKQIKDKSIKNACLITTLVDFSIPGDLGAFIDEEQIQLMEQKMQAQGYHDSNDMSMTFNLLRANDMIWSNIVNSYLLGKSPVAFDLLYWNSDSTKIPKKVHSFYLRNMYLNNNLVKANVLKINNVPIDISKIDIPIYKLATKEDHIVPWQGAYKIHEYIKNVTFVLAESGHVAGVISPPNRKKYGFYTNETSYSDSEEWLNNSKYILSSWWENYNKWQCKFNKQKIKKIDSRTIKKYAIQEAPGTYIYMR